MDIIHTGAGAYVRAIARRFRRQGRKRAQSPIARQPSRQRAPFAKLCACALAILTPGSFIVLFPLLLIRGWRAYRAVRGLAPDHQHRRTTRLPLLLLSPSLFAILSTAALAFVLGGCSGIEYTTSDSTEGHATNLAPGEAVTVMLGHYRQCKGEKPECTDALSDSIEQGFERCVTESLRENWIKRNRYLQHAGLDVLAPEEFRRAAFPGEQTGSLPRTPQAVIEQLHDHDFAQRVSATHVRYLVILDAETTSGATKLDGGGAMGFLAIGASSRTTWTITATVLDMRDGVESGVATAESKGESGAGVAGYVIPFVPIFIVGSPENEACNELGKRVAQRFFSVPDGVQIPH